MLNPLTSKVLQQQSAFGYSSVFKNTSLGQEPVVPIEQQVHCDQCGFQGAKRIFHHQLIEKSCPRCDYWLVMTSTGRVVETGGIGSYASRSVGSKRDLYLRFP